MPETVSGWRISTPGLEINSQQMGFDGPFCSLFPRKKKESKNSCFLSNPGSLVDGFDGKESDPMGSEWQAESFGISAAELGSFWFEGCPFRALSNAFEGTPKGNPKVIFWAPDFNTHTHMHQQKPIIATSMILMEGLPSVEVSGGNGSLESHLLGAHELLRVWFSCWCSVGNASGCWE